MGNGREGGGGGRAKQGKRLCSGAWRREGFAVLCEEAGKPLRDAGQDALSARRGLQLWPRGVDKWSASPDTDGQCCAKRVQQ